MKYLVILFLSLSIAGCGGGGGGSSSATTNPTSSLTISGTAATGAAIQNGTVTATCASGTGTAITGVDGTYTMAITNGVGPCIISVNDPITGQSYFSALEANATVANITPVTHLVTANLLGVSDISTVQGNFLVGYQEKITAVSINNSEAVISAATAVVADANFSGTDPLKDQLVAAYVEKSTGVLVAGNAHDVRIDALMAAFSVADVRLSSVTNQLYAASLSTTVLTMSSIVGTAANSLTGCPSARSGNYWLASLSGSAPILASIDYNALTLTTNSTSYTIVPSNVSSCVYSVSIGGVNYTTHISTSALGAMAAAGHLFLIIPDQNIQVNNNFFVGNYAGIASGYNKSTFALAAIPFGMSISSAGSLNLSACNLNVTPPSCSASNGVTTLDLTGTSSFSGSTPISSSDGSLVGVFIAYEYAYRPVLIASLSTLANNPNLGGVMIMVKVPDIVTLPTVNTTYNTTAKWETGYNGLTQSVVAGDVASASLNITSVDQATNGFSYTLSSVPNATFTAYLNSPMTGVLYNSASDGSSSFSIGVSTLGWQAGAIRSSGQQIYNEWLIAINY